MPTTTLLLVVTVLLIVLTVAPITVAFAPMRPAIRFWRQSKHHQAAFRRQSFILPSSSPIAYTAAARYLTPRRCHDYYCAGAHRESVTTTIAGGGPLSRQTSANVNSSSSFIPEIMAVDDNKDVSNDTYTPYEQWVRRLYQTNLFHPVKLGLQNMQQLHDLLGRPMDNPNVTVIHIAGTNGKGSVAFKIARTLQLSNCKKVGLFCSPHVSSFRERMQVNGELISEEQVVELLPTIYQLCQEHDIAATFFEITTALAFAFFAQEGVDVVVLETGLGGRLDATNVICKPALSIITSIGLEHTRILGDTVELIALEKGGIIKPDCPVLVGPNVPHGVLRQCAAEKGAKAYYTCEDVLGESPEVITDYDVENARIAKAAIELLNHLFDVPPHILEQGTRERPPCRFELLNLEDNLTLVLDVAHNPAAMKYLVHKLQDTYPNEKFRVVVGMSSDKDLGQCGRSILEVVEDKAESVHVVQAAHPRAAPVEAILEAEPRLSGCHWDDSDRSIARQVREAVRLARDNGEVLVVCGSVFLMSEAREALGIDEPRDTKCISDVAGANLRSGQENFGNTTATPNAVK